MNRKAPLEKKKKKWPKHQSKEAKTTSSLGNRNSRREREGLPLTFLEETEFIIDGLSALNEYLRFRPKKIVKIICSMSDRKKLVSSSEVSDARYLTLDQWLEIHGGLPVKSQIWGIVKVDVLNGNDLKSRLDKSSSPLILALDHVTDPRNLGAVARSCGFFGVKEILIPKDRQVKLTAASVSTSQGAFSLVDLFAVTNLSRELSLLKDMGYWIVGADMGGEALREVAGFYDKTVVVLGAEGSGLSQVIRKQCDRFISIAAYSAGLESLNVSVAGGIIINEFVLQNSLKNVGNNS